MYSPTNRFDSVAIVNDDDNNTVIRTDIHQQSTHNKDEHSSVPRGEMNIDDESNDGKMLLFIETTKNKRKLMIDERSEHRNSTIDDDDRINAKQHRTRLVDAQTSATIVIIEPSSHQSSTHFAIDQLPDEILEIIFSHFTSPKQICTQLAPISYRWHRLAYSRSVWRRHQIQFDIGSNREVERNTSFVQLLSKVGQRIRYLL